MEKIVYLLLKTAPSMIVLGVKLLKMYCIGQQESRAASLPRRTEDM
jgi:hypothetical protein